MNLLRCMRKVVITLLFSTLSLTTFAVGTPYMDELASSKLYSTSTKVLLDNDMAFDSKIEMIEKAKREIDLAYYIFNVDESSSFMASKLVERAREGVKVRILIDYNYNYKNLDFFSMLEKEANTHNSSGGSLQVRFYNRPSKNIIRDAFFLTTSCPRGINGKCSKDKTEEIKEYFENFGERNSSYSNLNNGFSGVFLSGLYTLNPEVMAWSLIAGQRIEVEKILKGSDEEVNKDDIVELLKIYFKSQYDSFFNRLVAKTQLLIARIIYGDQVDSLLNLVSSLSPIEQEGTDERGKDYEHLLDYLHHKFLLVDQQYFQIGGRNIENSYHMKPNKFTDKYLFMDTDIVMNLNFGGADLRKTFSRIWDYQRMVASIDEIKEHAPNDFLVNFKAIKKQCEESGSKYECAQNLIESPGKKRTDRLKKEASKMRLKASSYLEYKKNLSPKSKSSPVDYEEFKSIDVGRYDDGVNGKDFALYYLENLPFFQKDADKERLYGSKAFQEEQSGKQIHAWLREKLENVCRISAEDKKEREVFFHHAYVFPNGEIMDTLYNMINGNMNCKNVKITILTNSIMTTDLAIINLFAKYSMKGFFDYYYNHRDKDKSATVKYLEYQSLGENAFSKISLHSKVTIIDQDVYIGSANMDVRSYMMDTNNGVVILNAKRFLASYRQYLSKILNSGLLKEVTYNFKARSLGNLSWDLFQALQHMPVAKKLHGPIKKRILKKAQGNLTDREVQIELMNTLDQIRTKASQLGKKVFSKIEEIYEQFFSKKEINEFNRMYKFI